MKYPLVVVLILLCSTFAYSLEYYVDEQIVVDEKGSATISGEANIDILNYLSPENDVIEGDTPELTEKKDKYWLFNYEHEENLSSILIDLYLPEQSSINYIDTNLKINIETSEKGILIKFFGTNTPLKIKVQYSISEDGEKTVIGKEKNGDNTLLIIAGGIILLLLVLVIYLFIQRTKEPEEQVEAIKGEIDHKRLNTIRPTLTESQIRIIDALIEKGGSCSQSVIHHMTKIAKSSLSRNIENMHKRNIVIKFYNGTSNHVKLHPSFYN